MKITVKSDIHLEFGPADAGKGDVLLLCGDICTAHDICSYPAKELWIYGVRGPGLPGSSGPGLDRGEQTLGASDEDTWPR